MEEEVLDLVEGEVGMEAWVGGGWILEEMKYEQTVRSQDVCSRCDQAAGKKQRGEITTIRARSPPSPSFPPVSDRFYD